MISLWIATFCSASIALLFKFSAIKKLDQSWVTMANYLTASLFSGYMLLTDPFDYAHGNDLSITLIIGLITGVFFLLSFVVYQISVRNNGASMSGMFAKLGILIPMIVSVVVWVELIKNSNLLVDTSGRSLSNPGEMIRRLGKEKFAFGTHSPILDYLTGLLRIETLRPDEADEAAKELIRSGNAKRMLDL